MAGSDWIQAAQLIYGMYKDQNPPKPKFAETPLSPEQKQLHELYLTSLMNPATANNAAYVNNIAQQQLAGLSGMKWTSPKTFSGDTGYSGSNTSFTTPWAPGAVPTAPAGSGNTISDNRDKFPRFGIGDSSAAPRNAPPQDRMTGSREGYVPGGNGGEGAFGAFGRNRDDGGWSQEDESIGNFYSRNPRAGPRDVSERLGPVTQPPAARPGYEPPTDLQGDVDAFRADLIKGATPEERTWYAKIDDSWDAFRSSHPNWARLSQAGITSLLGAFTGAPGALISRYIFRRLNADDGATQPQPAGRTIGD